MAGKVPIPQLQASCIIEEIPLLVRTLAHFAVGSVMAVGEAPRVVHDSIEFVLFSWQVLAISKAPGQCRLRMRFNDFFMLYGCSHAHIVRIPYGA